MARQRSHVQISMFPFLSVLCTVIGVLVLFIVLVLSTRVVQQEELYARTQDHKNKPRPGSPDALEQGVDASTFAEVEAEITVLREILATKVEEHAMLSKKLAALEDLVEFKKTQQLVQLEPSRGRPLVKPERVKVVAFEGKGPADGFKVRLRPVFIECASQGYTIHPSSQEFPIVGVSDDDDGETTYDIDNGFAAFLKEVDKQKKRQYLVFLIHPNGIEAYEGLRRYVTAKHGEVGVGWEPFSREWLVVNDQIQAMFDEQERQND